MTGFYKKRGAALLVILSVIAVIIPLLQGVWLDSQIEYQFHRYRMNKLQARYNAKSGLALSLLRVYIFKGIEKSLPKQWKPISGPMLDQIWSFPFVWPLPPSEDLLESEVDTLQNLTKQSFIKGAYGTSLFPEAGLLDLNDLSSPLQYLREFTYSALLNLLSLAVEEQEKLRDKYDLKDLERILNNLSDWTDLDNESQNGGLEDLLEPGKKPLNRSFASIEEIKKVPGVSLEIFDILKPHITVYGSKALNINYTNKKILQALNIPEDFSEQILLRTQKDSPYYKPFLNQKDFCDFTNTVGLLICEEIKDRWNTLDMLYFDYPMAFRIKSSGEYRGQIINLEGLIYDLSAVGLNYQKSLHYEKQRQKEEESPAQRGNRSNESEIQAPTQPERAKINYSYHKSLIIMYLKESF